MLKSEVKASPKDCNLIFGGPGSGGPQGPYISSLVIVYKQISKVIPYKGITLKGSVSVPKWMKFRKIFEGETGGHF